MVRPFAESKSSTSKICQISVCGMLMSSWRGYRDMTTKTKQHKKNTICCEQKIVQDFFSCVVESRQRFILFYYSNCKCTQLNWTGGSPFFHTFSSIAGSLQMARAIFSWCSFFTLLRSIGKVKSRKSLAQLLCIIGCRIFKILFRNQWECG